MSAEIQRAQFHFIPARHLALSPLNVRQTGGERGIEELAELIAAEGVLQNLNVYEQPAAERNCTTHAVIAGGRRWRALQRLIEQGRIEADYPVPCMVVNHERAVQISLSENSGREPMHPADEFEAFRQLIDAGQSIEDVAARFGVTPLVVQRRLKLANVSPSFIALYREGKITLEHLMAFAVTDDHERQRQAWESLKAYERHPETLRNLLTQDELSMKEPIARYVGLKAYQKAGGIVRRDLFSDDNEAMVDAALIRTLAAEKLERHAAKLRAEGLAWVESHVRFDYATRAAYGHVSMIEREPTPEEQRDLAALESRQAQLNSASDGESAEDEARLDADRSEIENEIDALRKRLRVPHPEQQALAGAVVSIGRDGKVSIERDLLKPEDAERFVRARQSLKPSAASEAPRLHSAALVRRLTAQRTLALQAELVQQPMTAAIALTHRLALATFYAGAISGESAVRIEVGTTLVGQHASELEGTAAQEALSAHRQRYEEALPSDPEDLLAWLTAQSGGELLALLAYCVAVTVDGVQSTEGPCALDALAKAAKLDMRRWWQPTAENYFGSVPKTRILAVITEAVSPSAAAPLAKLKKDALAQAAERELSNKAWLPSLMHQPE
jgi:ParB family transcriptional regulator, chromosome partitioning protein